MHYFKKYSISLFLLALNINVVWATDSVSESHQPVTLYSALLDSIKMDSDAEVKQLIAFGADINYRYEGEKTPLILASELGKTKSVKTLLELGSIVDLKSEENMTALDYAHKNNRPSVSNILEAYTLPEQPLTKRQIITTIQFYLNRLGYVAGDLDGIYGSKTRNSLKQFSIDFNQSFPIEISERQIEELFHQISKSTLTDEDNVDPDHKKISKIILKDHSENSSNELAITDSEMSHGLEN